MPAYFLPPLQPDKHKEDTAETEEIIMDNKQSAGNTEGKRIKQGEIIKHQDEKIKHRYEKIKSRAAANLMGNKFKFIGRQK